MKKIRGWVYRIRKHSNIIFIKLRNEKGVFECVVKKDYEKAFNKSEELSVESSVELSGIMKSKPDSENEELLVKEIKIFNISEDFPIRKDQSTELLLDYRHLWLRSRKLTVVNKIKSSFLKHCRDWFRSKSFYEVTPPVLTSSACEGGTTLFELDYFGEKGYLSQSAQLYLESLIYSLEKVYSLTPSFRAEKSRTRRHLAEYWHLEAEKAFCSNEENMKIQEELISYAVKKIFKEHRKELVFLGRKPEILERIKPPFRRMSYGEAVESLQDKGISINWGEDLGTKEERILTKDLQKPLFVYNYPKKIKAFYMKINSENPKTVLCADMLAPEGYGEIIGGSERIWRKEELLKRMKEEGLEEKNYKWYIDLRKYGSVPHSGFGLGVERVLRWICKLEHIRDAIPYPRVINRLRP